MELSNRVQLIKPSPTLAVTNKANELKAAGKDIIGLGAGEPDFDTPEHIKQAAISAIKNGQTRYTAVDGTPELKGAIIDKFKRDNKLEYTPKQILVSSGGKQSFFNLSLALLNPGDEVVIPAPYWVSYPDMVKIAEGKPVIVETSLDNRFKMTAEQLSAAITDKTKIVVLNSPSNPTGIAYTREELVAIGEALKQHPEILVVTDDMYEHILWTEQPFVNILNACPELYDRTFVLNGVSKAYSMTGWRIGYAAGPEKAIAAMKKIQSQSTSNPCSISQAAALEALNGSQECITTMVTEFKKRHDYLVAALNELPGVECISGDGTFYVFPNFQGAIDNLANISNDVEMAEMLLSEAGVALVPGSAFGSPGCMRLSFATSMEILESAISRLKKVL
ncbi:aspartate aminotransferase [Oleiphilus sp. HI0078]|nr:aspartate aminotransferase [Oleiphilus sp. HI0043]KZY56906.1 aspartate aminotransferase [Oleiphilus sp. HI0061]KZY79854.1 aspartate aminotransferase [Oleiphilus sp. HI0069]KZY95977.1 aspartate aminotransferase [Oleiphilus sp. HI0072]KZZ14832.1 aspartate aminotransferase [Oleiphilus sp. HI0078]KZZ69092.1 aspartate aminotransferase [Oleiphilus sp. HI0128]KZZ76462.1 aspartate aminotransferase [Oleiphilus sp. HI0132]